MKFKIENIEELTDSRQVMESKPNKFISIFVGLVLIILIISFIWLWFGEKEEVIKVSGIINLKEQSQVVSNEISGTVKEFNVKNGEDIKQGNIIYTLDDTSFITQKENLESQKENLVSTNEKLDKFIKSINDGVNYFEENEEEKEFYNSKIEELDISIKEVNTNIEKCSVKSEVDGRIDIKNELQPGMIVQSGFVVGEIITNENNLQVELIIPDKDIGKLKINQSIKYNITSLPYTEFGFINGEIESLSISSNVEENTGIVYYTEVGNLEKIM